MNKNQQNFFSEQIEHNSQKEILSPSGQYRLTIKTHTTKNNTWAYAQGRVECYITDVKSRNVIATINRNCGYHWYLWHQHNNGCEYLLYGDDQQKQIVANLTKKIVRNFLNDDGDKNDDHCWYDAFNAHPSPDSKILAIEKHGSMFFFDFTNPEKWPYTLVGLFYYDEYCDDSCYIDDIVGWISNNTFRLTNITFKTNKIENVDIDF